MCCLLNSLPVDLFWGSKLPSDVQNQQIRVEFFIHALQGLRLYNWEEALQCQSMSDIQELEINTYWPCSSAPWLPEGLKARLGEHVHAPPIRTQTTAVISYSCPRAKSFPSRYSLGKLSFFSCLTWFVLVTELQFMEVFSPWLSSIKHKETVWNWERRDHPQRVSVLYEVWSEVH